MFRAKEYDDSALRKEIAELRERIKDLEREQKHAREDMSVRVGECSPFPLTFDPRPQVSLVKAFQMLTEHLGLELRHTYAHTSLVKKGDECGNTPT